MNPKDHPNASVAMIAGAVVANVVWILAYYHIDVPTGISAGWVTLVIGGLLYIGGRKRTVRKRRRTRATKPAAVKPSTVKGKP